MTRDSLTGGTTYFSRNGSLSVDGQRYLIDSNGGYIQVLPVDAEGNVTASGLDASRNIQLPLTSGTPRADHLGDARGQPAEHRRQAGRRARSTTRTQPYAFDRLDPNSYNYSQQTTVYDNSGKPSRRRSISCAPARSPRGDAADTWDVHMFIGNEEASTAANSATPAAGRS